MFRQQHPLRVGLKRSLLHFLLHVLVEPWLVGGLQLYNTYEPEPDELLIRKSVDVCLHLDVVTDLVVLIHLGELRLQGSDGPGQMEPGSGLAQCSFSAKQSRHEQTYGLAMLRFRGFRFIVLPEVLYEKANLVALGNHRVEKFFQGCLDLV